MAAAVALGAGCSDSTGPDPEQIQTTETFEWSGQVAVGDQVEIKGISGNITFLPVSGSAVDVQAVKTSKEDDVRTVSIEVVEHADGVTICAVYPDLPGQAANECLPGLQGNLSSRDNDVDVDFTVRVPAGRTLVGTAVSGNLSAMGVENDAFLTSVSGNIDIATTAIAEGTAISGNITATIGRTDWGRDLGFNSISGNVTVRIPSATNAVVDVMVVSGTVSSDFPLMQMSAQHLHGTLGTGGPRLTVASVSGNARLLRG
jgi:hypothetical protein